MSAGLPSDIATLNRTCGQAVCALAAALDDVVGINAMLTNSERGFMVVTNEDNTTTDPLVTGGMTTQDAATLRDSFIALSELAQVAYGQLAQSGAQPSNFFYQAQQLMGVTPL